MVIGVILVAGIVIWKKKNNVPVAIVVPHHNYVKEIRKEYLEKIKKERAGIKRIIIVGPDHFSVRQDGMMYANTDWNLSNGKLAFDKESEGILGPGLNLENNWVKNDHTIYNLAPEIKEMWPEVKIFPILLGQKIPVKNLDGLVEKIGKVCKEDCLLVVSVDFSHYLPAAVAEVHDVKSVRALEHLELEEIEKLEVDSQQSLYILMKFSLGKGARKWGMFSYTNTGLMEKNPEMETTSHVMGGYSKGLVLGFNKSNPYTFMVSKNTDFERDKKTLGERFFYGVDGINVDKLPFELGENQAVWGVKKGKKVEVVIRGLEMKNGVMYLLKGDDRMSYEE